MGDEPGVGGAGRKRLLNEVAQEGCALGANILRALGRWLIREGVELV
jgi:hypothetical protein